MKKALVNHMQAQGVLNLILRDKDGNIKEMRQKVENLVVNTGLYHIADQLADSGEGAMSHAGVGTGSTAANASDTTLGTQIDRNALTSVTQGTAGNANKVTYVADWAAGDGTGAITEFGIFNAASDGVMLSRTVFSAVNKGASDTLQITYTLTISAA